MILVRAIHPWKPYHLRRKIREIGKLSFCVLENLKSWPLLDSTTSWAPGMGVRPCTLAEFLQK